MNTEHHKADREQLSSITSGNRSESNWDQNHADIALNFGNIEIQSVKGQMQMGQTYNNIKDDLKSLYYINNKQGAQTP